LKQSWFYSHGTSKSLLHFLVTSHCNWSRSRMLCSHPIFFSFVSYFLWHILLFSFKVCLIKFSGFIQAWMSCNNYPSIQSDLASEEAWSASQQWI
jgi:hypothetical protein